MAIKGTNGRNLDVSSDVVRVNNFYRNGTSRKSIRPSQAKDYGAKRSVTAARMFKPVGKEAFQQIAPVRKSGPSYEAYKQSVEMEGVNMRGRVKQYYDAMSGGRPEADMSEAAAYGPQESSAQYYDAPDAYEYGIGSYVEVRGEEPGPYVPYEQVGSYVETRGEAPGYYKPYAQVGDLGQTYTAEQQLWRGYLEDFGRDVQNFNLFTTSSQEKRAWNKGLTVVETGRKTWANNPQMLSTVNGISGEMERWKADRAATITGAAGSSNQFGISKIRDRMLNAVNIARVAVGLASLSGAPIVPGYTVPEEVQQEAPGAATPAGQVAIPPAKELTFFEKNKTLVIAGGVLAALGLGYYLYKKG